MVSVMLLGGCAAPVAIRRLEPREAQLALTANVLTTGKPSDFSNIVLRKNDLLKLYSERPNDALASLRAVAIKPRGQEDELFALAELSYAYAEECAGRPYYLAAALYAYAVLFPGRDAPRLEPIDPRARVALDIYNRAVSEAFESDDEAEIVLAAGLYELPFGTLEVSFDPDSLNYGGAKFSDLLRIADYKVTGFRNRYRKSGIGAPVAARAKAPRGSTMRRYLPGTSRVPSTVLLTLEDPRRQLAGTAVRARVEFIPFSSDADVQIDGKSIPLESEPTATLAAALAESKFWKSELARFLGRPFKWEATSRLSAIEPPGGRIPVVFVHGTNSSSARWADMVNDLINDPEIHQTFSFWFFSYMSSQPIALSARELRLDMLRAMQELRDDGNSACADAAIVIGHSQGGLLTKMTAIESENRFWNIISNSPFENARLPDDERRVIQEALFVEPLPFVKRVIFIATPHRGSFLAGPQFVRRLIERLVTFPVDVLSTSAALASAAVGYDTTNSTASLQRVPTSIDNMSPGHPFIQTLAKISVAPSVIVNSIIPVKEGYEPYEDGNDGVVKYKSAHIEGGESEFVVRSPHSTQSNPHTIEEVRRILRQHADIFPCARAGLTTAAPKGTFSPTAMTGGTPAGRP